MRLDHCNCYLVHPGKRVTPQPDIGSTAVPKTGRLRSMLQSVFDKSEAECLIEISFRPADDGSQRNDCRDALLAYAAKPTLANGRAIAERLQVVTTERSGLGLLFLLSGSSGRRSKIVISRFPADQGVVAEEGRGGLNVAFVEKVFMKNASSYKAAMYVGTTSASDFWVGRAVDRQINNAVSQLANYWIREFLASDFRTTPAAGSQRMAIAVRSAMRDVEDLADKEALAAAVKLAAGMGGRATSISSFCSHFGLRAAVVDVIRRCVGSAQLMDERFQLDYAEFAKHVAFRSTVLSNGAVLTAEASVFDEVFTSEPARDREGEVRITTQGRVVDERFRTTAP